MKGYRTIIWNLANAVGLAMEATNATYRIPEEWMPAWMGVFIVVNIILRYDTTGPVGNK